MPLKCVSPSHFPSVGGKFECFFPADIGVAGRQRASPPMWWASYLFLAGLWLPIDPLIRQQHTDTHTRKTNKQEANQYKELFITPFYQNEILFTSSCPIFPSFSRVWSYSLFHLYRSPIDCHFSYYSNYIIINYFNHNPMLAAKSDDLFQILSSFFGIMLADISELQLDLYISLISLWLKAFQILIIALIHGQHSNLPFKFYYNTFIRCFNRRQISKVQYWKSLDMITNV